MTPTWRLDTEAFQHAILDLIGGQDPPMRRQLLEALVVNPPGTSVAIERVSPDVADVYVRDLAGEWHHVGTLDFAEFERAAAPDWN